MYIPVCIYYYFILDIHVPVCVHYYFILDIHTCMCTLLLFHLRYTYLYVYIMYALLFYLRYTYLYVYIFHLKYTYNVPVCVHYVLRCLNK